MITGYIGGIHNYQTRTNKPLNIRLYRRESNKWSLYGECFECGEFLYWAEHVLKYNQHGYTSISLLIHKEVELDESVSIVETRDLLQSKTMDFIDVKWSCLDHTASSTSACSGYGQFEAETLSITVGDKTEIIHLKGEPGYGAGI